MNVKPLNDRVLVEPVSAEQKTAGGILLPDSAQEKPLRGKVLAVGDGTANDSGVRTALAVNVGDTVVYGKYAGTDITVAGKELKIMRENDILAKVTK